METSNPGVSRAQQSHASTSLTGAEWRRDQKLSSYSEDPLRQTTPRCFRITPTNCHSGIICISICQPASITSQATGSGVWNARQEGGDGLNSLKQFVDFVTSGGLLVISKLYFSLRRFIKTNYCVTLIISSREIAWKLVLEQNENILSPWTEGNNYKKGCQPKILWLTFS